MRSTFFNRTPTVLVLLLWAFGVFYQLLTICLPFLFSPPSVPTLTHLPYDNLLHIGILTHPPNHNTLPQLMDHWGTRFLKSPYSGGIHIITDSSQKVVPSIPTVIFSKASLNFNGSDPDWQWNRKPMVAKRVISAKYFYFNTTAKWYILMTDNAFLFLENLREMLAEITRRWKPDVQAIVLGNCMSTHERAVFLQGGTGWLMSRGAVRDFLKISTSWFEKTKTSEDLHFAMAMKELRLSVREATSPYFLGQYLMAEDFELMERFNFSMLVKCPRPGRIFCKNCKPFVAPFRKIVFLHRLSRMGRRQRPHPMEAYPENLGWYMCGEFPHFCQLE